jgi:hypothetical protein
MQWIGALVIAIAGCAREATPVAVPDPADAARVDTTASWYVDGPVSDATLGSSIASGDVNADGYADVIVGAPTASSGQAGEGMALVYYGGPTGLSSAPDWSTEANQAGAKWGYSVAAIDLDGDGDSDVIVGSPSYDNGQADEGRVTVYLGDPAGLSTTGTSYEPNLASADFGASLAVGDYDGDGYGDLAVGADGYSNGQASEGAVLVYAGGPTGSLGSAYIVLESNLASNRGGAYGAGAGDINGDGYDDMVQGSTGFGWTYVHFGGPNGITSASAITLSTTGGTSFGTACDVNGDGKSDVLVGASAYTGGQSNEGQIRVHYGKTALSSTPDWKYESNIVGAGLGNSVACAGDLNGDGYGDIVAGAAAYDGAYTDQGRAYVFLGGSTGPAAAPSWTVNGTESLGSFGSAVAAAGDTDADGSAELLVGANRQGAGTTGRLSSFRGAPGLPSLVGKPIGSYQNVQFAGDVDGDGRGDVIASDQTNDVAVLFRGAVTTGVAAAPLTTLNGAAGSGLGATAVGVGDINGDGFADVGIGSPTLGYGRAEVYAGTATGLDPNPIWQVDGTFASQEYGSYMYPAGDVDGDGYDDFTVTDAMTTYDNGVIRLYRGGPTPPTTPILTVTGNAGDWVGRAAAAGDLDGDGFDDLAVSAIKEGASDIGAVYVYRGGPAGPTSRTWTRSGENPYDQFGTSVGFGDIDGDGYADLVVGAYSVDGAAVDTGRIYIFKGSASGPAATASWTIDGAASPSYLLGEEVAVADFDGDGYADIVAHALSSNANLEKLAMYLGSPSGPSALAWGFVPSTGADDHGNNLNAGDVDGDGLADVIASRSGTYGPSVVFLSNAEAVPGSFAPAIRAEDPQDGNRRAPPHAWLVGDQLSITGFGDSPLGRTRGALEVEVAPAGVPFDLSNRALGGTVDLTGAQVSTAVSNLTPTTAYHWRARFRYDPSQGRPQGTSRWFLGGISGQPEQAHVHTACVNATWYVDSDGDGFGTAASTTISCVQPAGYSGNAADCDDARSTVHPGAVETCNAVDDDCDSLVDDGLPTTTVYRDADGDGSGWAGTTAQACGAPPAGYVTTATDCDDTKASVHPGAAEVCNGADDDCDGATDEGVTSTYYADGDADGYGWSLSGQAACSAPAGYVADATDCNDASAAIHPGAVEVCNGADDDCDGQTDEGVKSTYYRDQDGDGYGDLAVATQACSAPIAYVSSSSDCNDVSASIHPTASELCNGLDDDCDGQVDEGASSGSWYGDGDGDGHGAGPVIGSCTQPAGTVGVGDDCDDANAAVYPGATEACNGVDDDCDAQIDESAGPTWYRDADADGHGTASTTTRACTRPSGYVATADDCDDTVASTFPGATELCNGRDDDCDGPIDEGVTTTYYADADADGFGGTTTVAACARPSGYASLGGDCDDARPTVHPGAAELCDGLDQDCDGQVDEGVLLTWHPDGDGDGFGRASGGSLACTAPAGTVADATDCDDAAAAVHPGADEVCDHVDEDCDGSVDEDALDPATWFLDVDADGYGDANTASVACDAPAGGVADASDCDDTAATVHPDAPEQCNGVDDDCDGSVDDNVVTVDWYLDADADGYGTGAPVTSCVAPAGTIDNALDCDDGAAAIHPGANEACNLVDDDCDGAVDDGVVYVDWYVDADGDGFGDDGQAAINDCARPTGRVAASGDCDDTSAGVSPAVTEVCDGADQDCDGAPDDGIPTASWWPDADGDGFGDAGGSAVDACGPPPGTSANASDCDDGNARVSPLQPEVCDGLDQDCDGVADDGLALVWHADDDGDGYGDPLDTVTACGRPAGTVADGTDCDDGAVLAHPGAVEQCNLVDDDCNGLVDDDASYVDWWPDADRDGFGDANGVAVNDCVAPTGTTANAADCDDGDPNVHPGLFEVCDGIDQDCDGLVDDDPLDGDTFFLDGDGDGHGDPSSLVSACGVEAGVSADELDCDDTDAGVYGGATEICDGVDQDCDGRVDDGAVDGRWYADADGDGYGDPDAEPIVACDGPSGTVDNADDCDDTDPELYTDVTYYADADGDGHGDAATTTEACGAPSGYVALDDDCDDSDPTTWPGADELCDGLDNDCDAAVDNGVVYLDWFEDADGDGFGASGSAPVTDCDAPDGYAGNDDDCDDGDPAINPDAVEIDGDGTDQDCDGLDLDDPDGDGVVGALDCDPNDAGVYTGAEEIDGDGIDQDCDGQTDTIEDLKLHPCGCASEGAGSRTLGVLLVAAVARIRRRSDRV